MHNKSQLSSVNNTTNRNSSASNKKLAKDKISYSPSTLRPVSIPKQAETLNSENLKSLPVFNLQKSKMVDGNLIFEKSNGFWEAIKNGFFLIEIPTDIDVTVGDRFCRNFYKEKDGSVDDSYKGFKHIELNESYQGYFDREHDQWENFFIASHNWQKCLPLEVQVLGNKLQDLGINILKNVLKKIKIPKKHWLKITGGLIAKKGFQLLAFNHFRAEKNMRGSKFHRDLGWVTVLRSTEPGLVGLIDDNLFAINPEEGFFIVNFGSTIEVLTEKLKTPVRANIHGVVKLLKVEGKEDRISYVTFLDSNFEENIYKYVNNTPIPVQTMKEFAIQEVGRTYQSDSSI